MNKAELIGHLGGDPELKYTPTGTAVVNFTVATSERYKDKAGNEQQKTEWHRIVVFGTKAENANKYLKKGSKVFIEGKIQTRSWDDKNGVKRYTTEIVVNKIEYLSSSKGGSTNKPADHDDQTPEYDITTDSNFTSDDIPF